MYRSVALLALENGIDADNEAALVRLYREHHIDICADAAVPSGYRVLIDGRDRTQRLFGTDVTAMVSTVAAHGAVRAALVERQQEIAREGPVVMAGRDIGTVVLPQARYKFFLTASVDERVKRRQAELAAAGVVVDTASLRTQIEERDRLDATRAVAPLRAAADAVTIDSTEMSIDDVTTRDAGPDPGGGALVSPFYAFIRGIAKLLLLVVWRMRVRRHRQYSEGRRRCIVAANHISYFDPPAVGRAWRPRAGSTYMAKAELFRIPLFGPFIASVGAYPISRGRGDIGAIKRSVKLLRDGHAIAMFPEGTRNFEGKSGAQAGAALLASLAGVPIVPAYIDGTDAACAAGPRITVTFTGRRWLSSARRKRVGKNKGR